MQNGIPEDFNIIIDADFDPMAILHGEQKLKSDKAIVKIPGDPDDDGDDTDPSKVVKVQPSGQQKTIELSDALLEQGFTRAKAAGSINAGGPDGKGSGAIQKPTGDDNPDNDPNKGQQTTGDKTTAFAIHYKMMVDAGEWDPIEDFDGTEEKYIEVKNANIAKDITVELDQYFDEAFVKNPEGRALGVALFNHLKSGGRVSDFQALYSPAEFDITELDNTDEDIAEETAKDLIRNYYTAIGWKKDTIDKRIAGFIKTGRLIDEGKEISEPYKDLIAQQQLIHQQKLDRDNTNKKTQNKKINDSIQAMINENKSFGEVKIYDTPKEKADFVNYLFTADDDTGRTAFSEDLNDVLKDPEFLVFAATAIRKKLYKNPDALKGDGKAAIASATTKLRSTLEGALLNKNITNSGISSVDSHPANKGAYKFDLENARVLS